MGTYLSKFSPNLSQKIKPLRNDLLSTKNEWLWEKCHYNAFTQIKEELSSTPVIELYNPSKETIVLSSKCQSFLKGKVCLKLQFLR